MVTISVPNTDIEICDSIGISRQRIQEAKESGLVTPNEPWCPRSFVIEAVYKGPEVIENRSLAARTHHISGLLTCM